MGNKARLDCFVALLLAKTQSDAFPLHPQNGLTEKYRSHKSV
jgi:hypothetical protein